MNYTLPKKRHNIKLILFKQRKKTFILLQKAKYFKKIFFVFIFLVEAKVVKVDVIKQKQRSMTA